MKNTELLYRKAKKYQDRRNEIKSKYHSEVEALERYKGSSGYDEELEQLQKNLDISLQNLKDECKPDMYTALKSMYAAVETVTIPSPTIEQINLLNMLKMKKKITEDDCLMVANSVKDNPIAVSIVSEIAHDNNILRSYDNLCPRMSTNTATGLLNGLKKEIDDFLLYDTSRISRMYQNMQSNHYGSSVAPLSPRKLFDSKEDFYSDFGIDQDTFGKFSEIVDHE